MLWPTTWKALAALFYTVSPLEGVAIAAREEFWEAFPTLYFAEDVAAEVMIHIGELSTNDDLAFSNAWSNIYRPQCVDLCSLVFKYRTYNTSSLCS
ncbi:unnamed protein product [Arabis nemorensis]|uniref:Uncharacterized protein n=1 Tax=Arabis nemorensis TaxID=586526 RepID=A0A565CN56_9BRAS|nr:unnamed protein product [Arabis nemorensis]